MKKVLFIAKSIEQAHHPPVTIHNISAFEKLCFFLTISKGVLLREQLYHLDCLEHPLVQICMDLSLIHWQENLPPLPPALPSQNRAYNYNSLGWAGGILICFKFYFSETGL